MRAVSFLNQPAKSIAAPQRRWAFASATALHASVLALLLVHPHPPVLTAVDRPGDATGHYLTLNWNPGGKPTVSAVATRRDSPPTLAPLPNLKSTALTAPTPAPATETARGGTQTGDSTDSLGNGEIVLALTTNHPPPKPDLSALPHGTHGDVVVDIVIDANGRIAKTTLVRGLGSPVDNTVLATVQQWMFTPATRNGQPITSEQELLFHYDHA